MMQTTDVQPKIIPSPMEYAHILNAQDQENRDLAKLTIDNTDLVSKLKAKYRGKYVEERINEDTGQVERVEKKFGEPTMNEEGINDVVGFVEEMIHRNTILSNIQDHNWLMDLMIGMHIEISELIYLNYEQYAIKESKIDFVIEEVTDIILLGILRGHERGEARLVYPGKKELVHYTADLGSIHNKGSIFGGLQ